MRDRRGGAGFRIVAGTVAFVLLGLAAVAVVPTLLRRDRADYGWRASWGAPGSGPGEFRGPIGVVVDDSGFVYVSDSGNDRIQKFTARGDFVNAWGGAGEAPGRLRRPMHLELEGDTLLRVAEYLNDRIQAFRLDGTPAGIVSEDTAAPGGALDAPGGVAAAPGGDELWVPDFFHHRVAVFAGDGGFLRQIGASGRWIPGRFHYPTDIAFGADGSAYIADAYNNRIQRYSPAGERLDAWGGPLGLGIPGPWKGWFSVATGVHAAADGRIYVADFYNHRIQVFGPSGDFVAEWGTEGSREGAFDRPTDVATGPGGRIYVVDFGNDRVQVFSCEGCDRR